MVTTDGLLRPGCVRGLRDALDRGVDVSVGSETSAVRDLVREEVHGVTIWKPQLDWFHLPPQREKLGRLLLADREAVVNGTLGERTADGGYRETAITGEDEDDSPVVLLRQVLGSRPPGRPGRGLPLADSALSRAPAPIGKGGSWPNDGREQNRASGRFDPYRTSDRTSAGRSTSSQPV
jgi:hypothetical protein